MRIDQAEGCYHVTARGNDRQDIFRDEAGRIAGVSNGDGSLYYAGASYSDLTNRIQYSPAGAMVQMRLGNGLWNDTRFNSRLQAIQIGLGQTRLTNLESTITPSSTVADKLLLDQCFSGTDTNCSNGVTTNNGNLLQQRIRKQGTPSLDLTQSYSYDVLNRITNASETPGTGTAWSAITYGLDRYGNRWVSTGYKLFPTLTPVSSAEFNAATNRMVSPSSYDAVGNLTNNKVSQTATYDAENRMTSFNSGVGITNYTYDGDGRRISKQLSSGATTYYVYNAFGQLAAEYSSQGPAGGGITYLTSDHLGSTRVTTDAAKAFKTCHDYLPYGEEIDPSYGGRSGFPCYTSTLLDGPTQKFTGKERDTESNLDYFLVRYYSGVQGRFLIPDPENAGGIVPDPQSWNGYAYGRNNPLVYTDPNGEKYRICDNLGHCEENLSDIEFDDYFQRDKNIRLRGGSEIWKMNKNGSLEKIGTYEQTEEDVRPEVAGAVGAAARYADAEIKRLIKEAIYTGITGGALGTVIQIGEDALPVARRLLPFKDSKLIQRINKALDDIAAGVTKYSRDGLTFKNREGLLPTKPEGYYREFTVQPGPRVTGRGADRLVVGQEGEVYYTPNHYGSFVRIQ
ncbi:MAG: ribonuclease domain-containing protein [Terriglobia bacterium]